ncbi:hypothetical protein Geob_3230 [Geotalea daltonii FRC-32]|uniref:DUF4365 domain-containing protein n=1 Tax=Geotalea daltonii (strain DSM 22248 / JCM 15807 / FRC-32) TaxID=316067 RepID=B9M4B8_GEODF|nr:DUF4365 domain-containing protein [Geotalea daltonii]ACM21573.1 hypothetical protein Geob_3230 [Geotalea daltonii FRC-32]
MKLPSRIKQHKAESDSYAILLYKLKNVGIFRNLTENDYGIDFEIEVLKGDQLTGRYVKVQVKSSEDLKIRKKDKVPTVGGIKDTTLNYWAELSLRVNVLAYAVDLKNENIYITKPMFWQATKLIDGSKRSKSIEFLPVDQYHSEVAGALTYAFALAPTASDIIHNHKVALKHLMEFIEFYVGTFHYDIHLPTDEPDVFRSFLDVCRILMWDMRYDKSAELSEEEQKCLLRYEYWAKQGNLIYDEIPHYVLQKPMKFLMPLFIKSVKRYNTRVLDARYYWLYNDCNYLRLVYECVMPEDLDSHEGIMRWGYDLRINGIKKPADFYMFLAETKKC